VNDETKVGQVLGEQADNVTDDMYDDIGGGIQASFPVISYRQSRWRIRYQGNEELLVDPQGRPVEDLAVCLVRVPGHKSKRFWYSYEQGSNKAPDCFSNDGIKPHPSLTPPTQMQGWPYTTPTTCAQCSWDQFGTSTRQDGSAGKGKACADYKRLAVKLYYPEMPPGFEAVEGQLILMQVPPDSLQDFKKYGDELARLRVAAAATVTFVGLVVNNKDISYPKLSFRKGPQLASDEIENIRYARSSDEAQRILATEIAFVEPAAIAYQQEPPVEQPQVAPPPPPPVTRAPPPATPRMAPQPAQAAVARGMPAQAPAPPRAAPASNNGRPVPPPRTAPQAPAPAPQPSARAVDPRRLAPTPQVSTTPASTKPNGGISAAVNRPSAPPPTQRAVRPPPRVAPAPVQEEPEYGQGGEVEDELDSKFGDLAAKGIIEQ
jgi:hypothetical protein